VAEAVAIDVPNRRVILSDGVVDYDTLIVATGATHHYFGHDEWEHYAPGLKTVEDATEIRRRILLAFEAAEREPNSERRRALLTFVVVGGGPTGVELAGAIGELAHHALRGNFHHINPSDAHVVLLVATDSSLPTYQSDVSSN